MPGFRRKKRRKKSARPDERTTPVTKPSHLPNVKQPLSQREIVQLQSTIGNQNVQRLLKDGTLQLARDDLLQREEGRLSADRADELNAINQTRKDYEAVALVAVTEAAQKNDLIQAISLGSMLLAQLTMWFERGPTTAEIDTTLLSLAAAVQDFVESLRDEIIAEEASMQFYEEELQKLNAQYNFLKPSETEDIMDDTITEQIETQPAQAPPQLEDDTAPMPSGNIGSKRVIEMQKEVDKMKASLMDKMTNLFDNEGTLEPIKQQMEQLDAASSRFFKDSKRLSAKEGMSPQQKDRQVQTESLARLAYEKKKGELHRERLKLKLQIKTERAEARNVE